MTAPFLTADWTADKPNELRFELDRRITHNERADMHRAVLAAIGAPTFGQPQPRANIPLPMRQAMNEGAHKRAIAKRQADKEEALKFARSLAKSSHGARSSLATLPFTRSELVELIVAGFEAGRGAGLREAADQIKGHLA